MPRLILDSTPTMSAQRPKQAGKLTQKVTLGQPFRHPMKLAAFLKGELPAWAKPMPTVAPTSANRTKDPK